MSADMVSSVYHGDWDAMPGIVHHHLPVLGIDGIGLVNVIIRSAAKHRVNKDIGHAQLSARWLAAHGIGRKRGDQLKQQIVTLFPGAFTLIPGTPTTPEQMRFDKSVLIDLHNAWLKQQGKGLEVQVRAALPAQPAPQAEAPAPAPQAAHVQPAPATQQEAPRPKKTRKAAAAEVDAEQADRHHRVLEAWNGMKGGMPGKRPRAGDGRLVPDAALGKLIDAFIEREGGEDAAIETLRAASANWARELERQPQGWLATNATIAYVFRQASTAGEARGAKAAPARPAPAATEQPYRAPRVI